MLNAMICTFGVDKDLESVNSMLQILRPGMKLESVFVVQFFSSSYYSENIAELAESA